ncbi:MAG: type II secretion system protein [Kiritimatiellae bacterium]|nr:type II secretion system protein [Kiritimatiellia bacterium]
MKNQRSGITLMELIIVLGMVSVLLAIALPAMRAVHAASLKRRAAAEATELAQGALRYKETYGFWPGEVKLVSDADTKVKLHEDTPQQNGLKRAALIVSAPEDILENLTEHSTGTEHWLRLKTNEAYRCFARLNERQATPSKRNPLNPKGIEFVGLDNEKHWDIVGKADPWGHAYTLLMGMNPRSQFRLYLNGTQILAVSNVTVLAFSKGAPEAQNATNYIFSAGVTHGK